MATRAVFMERWACLNDPTTSAEERAGNYAILTSHLKDPSIGHDFYQALVGMWRELTQRIVRDITCKSCDHAALQVLGYCLYLPSFCEPFTPDMVQAVVTGVCTVIQDHEITKSVCTRALWTLANQKLTLESHVTRIVTVVTELVLSPRLATPTVDSEALSVLIRLAEQCPSEFSSCSHVWYQAVFTLTLYGLPRLQSRALTFAISMEKSLVNNLNIFSWLTKELKKSAISKMLTQLSGRGQENCHVLKVWSHVIAVIGTCLHKQGSFLNELLRVVEFGFKHRSTDVQVMAYSSWKSLINNYSLNRDVLVSQKRLKLLLMPLVASAARDRHEQVDKARVDTYWHLIGCLGPYKEQLFQEVCVPFLLLCLGLDPKTVTTNLLSRFHSSSNTTPTTAGESPSVSTVSDNVMETPKGNPHTLGTLAVTPTPLKNAVSTKTPEQSSEEAELQRSKGSLVTVEEAEYKIGSLVNFVRSTRTKSKHADHYSGNPTVTMVMTGCHAFLQFLGLKAEISESLIKSDPDRYAVYPKFLVPLEVVEVFLLFLDYLLSHTQLFSTQDRSATLETVVHQLFSLLICCIDTEQAPYQGQSTHPSHALWIFNILTQLVQSSCLDNVLCKQMRLDVLKQLCSVPAQLSLPREGWRTLLDLLLGHCKTEQLNDWFSSTFHALLSVATTQHANSDPLKNLSLLLNRLYQCAKDEEASQEHLSFMWLLTTRAFCNYITKTNHINLGTALDPDLSIVGLILKFPFLFLIPHGTKETAFEKLQQWMVTFDLCARHTSLVVKDPNYCTQLVVKELYNAYTIYVKNKKNLELKSGTLKFDQFQNTMALVLRHLVNNISFSHFQLSGAIKGQRSNCFKIVLSLLSWQLVTLSDSVKHPHMLCQLTSPAVVMETVAVVFQRVSSNDMILCAAEMLSSSLATVWESIFHCDSVTLTKSRQKQQNDLMDHVTLTLKTIVSTFQTRYTGQYHTSLLNMLSPLLLTTLLSRKPAIMDITMTFWKLTFDQTPCRLVYPPKLREFFIDYVRSDNQMRLNFVGLLVEDQQAQEPSMSPLSTPTRPHHGNMSPSLPSNMSPSRHGNIPIRGDMSPGTVIHPVTSPRKNVRGSFMHRPTPSPHKLPPLSPSAKALDDVLARSAGTSTRSHDQTGGVSQAKETSARRKLTLNKQNEEMYVHVAPPPKKPRLLTEHQKEKRREKPQIPALYNALDPSQDASLPMSETQNMDIDDDVIFTHESPPPPAKYADSATTTSVDSAATGTSADSAFTTASTDVLASTSAAVVDLTSPTSPAITTSANLVTATTASPVTASTEDVHVSKSKSAAGFSKASVVTTADSAKSTTVTAISARAEVMATVTASTGETTGSVNQPRSSNPTAELAEPTATVDRSTSACSVTTPGSATDSVATTCSTAGTSSSVTASSATSTTITADSANLLGTTADSAISTTSSADSATIAPRSTSTHTAAQSLDTTAAMATSVVSLATTCTTLVTTSTTAATTSVDAHPPPVTSVTLTNQTKCLSLKKQKQNGGDSNHKETCSGSPQTEAAKVGKDKKAKADSPNVSEAPTSSSGSKVTATAVSGLKVNPSVVTDSKVDDSAISGSKASPSTPYGPKVLLSTPTPPGQRLTPLLSTPVPLGQSSSPLLSTPSTPLLSPPPQNLAPLLSTFLTSPLGSKVKVSIISNPSPTSFSATPLSSSSASPAVPHSVQLLATAALVAQLTNQSPVTTVKPLGGVQKPIILTKAQSKKDSNTSSASGLKTASSSENRSLGNSSSSTASETVGKPSKMPPSRRTGDRSGSGVVSETRTAKNETKVTSAPGKGEKNGGAEEEVCVETQSKEAVTDSGAMDKPPSTYISTKVSISSAHKSSLVSMCKDAQEEEAIAQNVQVGKEKVKNGEPSSRASATPPPSSSPSNSEDKSAQTTVSKMNSPTSQTVTQTVNQLVSPIIFPLPQWMVTLSACKAGSVVMTTVQSSLSTSTAKTTPTLASTPVSSSTVVTVSDEIEVDKDDTTTTIEDTQMEVDNDNKTKEASRSEIKTGSDDEIGGGNRVEVDKDEKKNEQDTISASDYVEVVDDEKETSGKGHAHLDVPIPQIDQTEVGVDLEDPLVGVKSRDKHVTEQGDPKSILLTTPTHRRPTEDGCPTGILKHVSQFDTPSSTTKSERRVQFAREHTVHVSGSREGKTPKHSRGSRTPQSGFSSRRTLLKSLTPPKKVISVPKSPQTPPPSSKDPIYPSLSGCPSPIEQILPSLTASKFTHGLVQLVRARNITTVGNISSLTEQQVQNLPIKSPKVVTLRKALRSFEKNLGSKRKSSTSDSDPTLLPPAKVARLTSDPKTTSEHSVDESEDIFDDVIPSTPPAQPLDLSTPDSQMVAMGDKELHPPNKDSTVTPDLLPNTKETSSETSIAGDHDKDPTNECHTSEPEVTMETEQSFPVLKEPHPLSGRQMSTESEVTMETDGPHPPPVLHDHMYCSQESSPTHTLKREDETKTCAESATVNRDKLSLGTSDHTYCKVGMSTGCHSDESSASQELFSCNTELDNELVADSNPQDFGNTQDLQVSTDRKDLLSNTDNSIQPDLNQAVDGVTLVPFHSINQDDRPDDPLTVVDALNQARTNIAQAAVNILHHACGGMDVAHTEVHTLNQATDDITHTDSIPDDAIQAAASILNQTHQEDEADQTELNQVTEPIASTTRTSACGTVVHDSPDPCADDPPQTDPEGAATMSSTDWDLLESLLTKQVGKMDCLSRQRQERLYWNYVQFGHSLFEATHAKPDSS